VAAKAVLWYGGWWRRGWLGNERISRGQRGGEDTAVECGSVMPAKSED
jgi:hypothetical protein